MYDLNLSFFQVGEDLAIVQVMHQTVREFFLRPHQAVARSCFPDIDNGQHARRMIQTTCVRYLKLHHKELIGRFQSATDDWRDADYRQFVRYLNTRPFIKYSLELLTRHVNNICSSPVTEDVPPRRDQSIHGVPPSVTGLVYSRSVPLHPTSVTGLVHSWSIHTKH